MLILIVLLMVAQPALPQQGSEPLTKGQVMDLVKFELDSTELANRIKERGLDFEPTDDDLEALRKAGAQEVVIQAIREVKPKPLTREQVGKLVAGGVPSERAATLVRKRGIDFQADEEYLKTLRVAGADDTLLRALRTASVSELGELLVTTSPIAGVSIDGVFQGKADSSGKFVVKVTAGTHMVEVSLEGKQNFSQSVTLAHGQTIEVRALLEDMVASRRQMSFSKAEGSSESVILEYPACSTVTHYFVAHGWRGHPLKKSDLNKGGNMSLYLQVFGCSVGRSTNHLDEHGEYYRYIKLLVNGQVSMDEVDGDSSNWFKADIPIALWALTTHVELEF